MVSCIGLFRVGYKFSHLQWVGFGWVSQLMGWVGSSHTSGPMDISNTSIGFLAE